MIVALGSGGGFGEVFEGGEECVKGVGRMQVVRGRSEQSGSVLLGCGGMVAIAAQSGSEYSATSGSEERASAGCPGVRREGEGETLLAAETCRD